jgi:hypothetical protein
MFSAVTSRAVLVLLAVAAFFPLAVQAQRAQDVPSIRSVQVLRGGNQVEIQIESSAPIVPHTNELRGPDRLLLDFVNARPGAQLRSQKVDRAEVKDLRVSLFSVDPPVTRIVIDLNSPQPYQVFPAGRTTIVKIGGSSADIAGSKAPLGNVVAANTAAADPPPAPPKPSLEVTFHDGLLSIDSDRATLSQVLFAVHQRTGAEIAIPAGTERDQVVVNLGPAPAPEVLSQLLNGSKFNFVILSSPKNPKAIDQVILSARTDAPVQAQAAAPQPPQPAADTAAASSDDAAAPPRFRMRGRGFPPLRGQGQEPPTEDQDQAPPPPENENPNPNPQ